VRIAALLCVSVRCFCRQRVRDVLAVVPLPLGVTGGYQDSP